MMQQHLQGCTDSMCYEPINKQRIFQKKLKQISPLTTALQTNPQNFTSSDKAEERQVAAFQI